MKIKLDFITNSSSASMYLYVKSSCETAEKFSDCLNKLFESDPEVRERITFLNPTKVTKFLDGVFRIEEWTSMYNDYHDLPEYFIWILIEFMMNKSVFSEYKIDEILKLEISHDY